MVQFSPELCMKLFKQNLRHITVQNTDTVNIQCAGAKYLLFSTHLHSFCNVPFKEYYSVYLHTIHQYNKLYFATENAYYFEKKFEVAAAKRAQ